MFYRSMRVQEINEDIMLDISTIHVDGELVGRMRRRLGCFHNVIAEYQHSGLHMLTAGGSSIYLCQDIQIPPHAYRIVAKSPHCESAATHRQR